MDGPTGMLNCRDAIASKNHPPFHADAQPVHDSAVGGQTTVLVTVAGTVKYGASQPVGFQQNFLITAKDAKWKVVTDTFRSQ